MRTAVLADIHGNLAALEAVLGQTRGIVFAERGEPAKLVALVLLGDLPDLPAGEVLVEILGLLEHRYHARHRAHVPSTDGLIEGLGNLHCNKGRMAV